MPRGRPRKPQETQTQQNQQNNEYTQNFALTLFRALSNPTLMNPILQNMLLKDVNVTGIKYDRDSVKKMLADPKNNEKQLKELANYLFNFIMQFKRLILYFSGMLSYDWYLEPTNADADDMNSKPFKKSYKKALQWIEDFEPKTELPKIVNGLMLEDAKFYYLRESENGIRLQELPSTYCMITSQNDLGYQYSFNMTYFLRNGVNFDDFAPEFRDYYNNFIGSSDYEKKQNAYKNGQYLYWQQLDPSKAWVFKFDQTHASVTPPLMGLFLDAIEIVSYKELLKTKTSLDVWKLLVNKIPIHKDGTGKSGNKKDDFAIMAETAGMFSSMMQAAVPQGVKVVTTPLDTEAVDFKQSDSKESIVGLGNDEFWKTSGAPPTLFGEKQLNASGLDASIKTDEFFVIHLYRQFERFINFQLKQITGRYRFKIHLEGTEFDRSERFERALKASQYGAPVTYVAVAMGKSQSEFSNMIDLEESLDLKSRMIPLTSSHTVSNSADEGGRPKKSKSELGDAGTKTRDNASNEDR